MSLTHHQVQHIANLARLELSEEELSRYQDQLSAILAYFTQLEDLDTENIKPTASGFDLTSTLRPDKARPGLMYDELIKNAPEIKDQKFQVPPVFDHD
jgi:aspartyl-tRNA(Asn)/glutamyl-tRNA(Gln) amidotransferase subunit C